MLLPDNMQPELSIYHNGSLVLGELKKEDNQTILLLYNSLKETGMSFATFLLCLDWLYLIDAAKVDEKGCVSLCI